MRCTKVGPRYYLGMDIAAIVSHLNTVMPLPFGASIAAQVPNNYLGVPDVANARIVVRVNDVCDAQTRKFRTPTQQRALAIALKAALLRHLPARCSKVHAVYFGHTTQYRDGYAFEVAPRFVMAPVCGA